MSKIIEIEELGFPKSLIIRDGALVSELIDTKDLVNELNEQLQQYNISGSVLKIKLTEYGYTCGDGCCCNYGTITKVNGVELPSHNQDAGAILEQVLEHLGYKVEIEYDYDV